MEYRTIKNIKELRVQSVEYYFWREREGMPESIVTVHVGQAVDPAGEWSGPIPTQKEFEMIQGVLEGVNKTVREKIDLNYDVARLEFCIQQAQEVFKIWGGLYQELLPAGPCEDHIDELLKIGTMRNLINDIVIARKETSNG